jgi:hypothetical protein
VTSVLRGQILQNATIAIGLVEVLDDGDSEITAAQQRAVHYLRDLHRVVNEKISALTLRGWRHNGLLYCLDHREQAGGFDALPTYDRTHDTHTCFECGTSLLAVRARLSS